MIKAVIFDIDNTLYDYDAANACAMSAIEEYASLHFGWSAQFTEDKVKTSYSEMKLLAGRKAVIHNRLIRFQRILEQENIALSPHALNMYDIYWSTLTESSKLFPGLTDALISLKNEGVSIGIGTNMTSVMQFRKLEALGILKYFDFIVSSEEAGSEKPDKVLFLMCAKKAGVTPDECLYVGDNLKNDIMAAERAGLKGLWFAPEKDPLPEGSPVPVDHLPYQEPDESVMSFSDYTDLPKIVSRLRSDK